MMSDRFYIGFSHDVTAAVLVLPDNEKVAAVVYQTNRPFPSCPLPLCQNESPCESIVMKTRFISKFIRLLCES